jgi:hypothetical protein
MHRMAIRNTLRWKDLERSGGAGSLAQTILPYFPANWEIYRDLARICGVTSQLRGPNLPHCIYLPHFLSSRRSNRTGRYQASNSLQTSLELRSLGYECNHQRNLKTSRGAKSNALLSNGFRRNPSCPWFALGHFGRRPPLCAQSA